MAMTGGAARLVKTGYANYGSDGPINLYVYYKSAQDTATNKSTVYVGMYATTPSSTYGIGPWADSVGSYVGTTSNTFDGDIPNFKGTRWLVEDKSFTVTHDEEGNAKATIYWKWGINSPWGQMVYPSGSFEITLPQIQRPSTITSASSANLGSNTTIKWTPKSKSFYYKVKLAIGDWSSTTDAKHPNSTSAYSANVPLPYEIANQLASDKKVGTVTATLYTYSDSACTKQVGSADTETFSITVPDNDTTKPDLTLSVAPVNTSGVAWENLYVQGITKVQPTITATGRYKSTISSRYMSLDGKNYTSSPYTSDVLSVEGERVVYGYATDSRGFKRSKSQKIEVIPYAKPTIKACSDEDNIVCDRCNSKGVLDESGTYLRIKAVRSYSKMMSGGTQHNFCYFYYRWKKAGGSYSSWIHVLEKTNTTTNTVDLILPNICTDLTSSYYVQLLVKDDVGKYTQTTYTVPTDSVDFNLREGGGGAAFGCYSEEENVLAIGETWELKIYGNRWKSLGLVNATAPTSSTYFGRAEPGTCSYRVENGNHVYVQISCGFTWAGDSIVVSNLALPTEYRPARDVFSYCASTGKYIVKLAVSSLGKVIISNVQDTSSGTHSDSATISWIDGYIDYFI